MRMFALITALAVALAACSRPYEDPIIAAGDSQSTPKSFPGIEKYLSDADAEGTTLKVIWTHGMCTHHMDWAQSRVRLLNKVLGGQYVFDIEPESPDHVQLAEATVIPNANKAFLVDYLIWSPMTVPYKRPLANDGWVEHPGDVNTYAYDRAELNSNLKTALLDDCLADAVVYTGEYGDKIKREMEGALCVALGGKNDPDHPCDIDTKIPANNGPVVIVTESLGSKILFDAVRRIWNKAVKGTAARDVLAGRLSHVKAVFMMSNQIPLLDLGGHIPQPISPGSSGKSMKSMDEFGSVMHEAMDTMMASNHLAPPAPPIVAFSDPNDLMSYPLRTNTLGGEGANVVNVIVSNVDTYLGFVERPDYAHCGYAWNTKVVGMFFKGYEVGKPVPSVEGVDFGKCF